MPVRVFCPDCEQPLDIVEKLEGKQVRCPECRRVFVFDGKPQTAAEKSSNGQVMAGPPTTTSAGTAPTAAPARSPDDRPAPRPSRESSGALLVIAVAGVLAVIFLGAGVVVVGMLYLGSARSPVPYSSAMPRTTSNIAIDNGPDAPDQPDPPVRIDPAALPEIPEPVAVKPPTLEKEQVERPLAGRVHDVVAGGGGRYLIFHLKEQKKLAIFDASAGRVVKELDAPEGDLHLAAGMEKLIVLTAEGIQRWSLTTFEREATAQLPVRGKVRAVAVGAASNGPLLVIATDDPVFDPDLRDEWALVDIRSLKPISLNDELQPFPGPRPGPPLRPERPRDPENPLARTRARATADGRAFAVWSGQEPEATAAGPRTLALSGNELVQYQRKSTRRFRQSPGRPDRLLYGGRNLHATQLLSLQEARPLGRAWAPVVDGPYFLAFQPDLPNGPEGIAIFHTGLDRPLAFLPARDLGLQPEALRDPAELPFDKRVHFLAAAKVLVVVPTTNDRLVVRRFDPEEALAKLDGDYLFVVSQPPQAVKAGDTFRYPIEVRSNQGGLHYRPEQGPAGMEVSEGGRLAWRVPLNQGMPETDIVISIRDRTGREIFHSFSIRHPGILPFGNDVQAWFNAGVQPGRPLTIDAPGLEKEITEVKLPGAVRDVAVGAGGRNLVLHLPAERKLAVFDVTEAKIVREIRLPDEPVLFAAGMDQVVVVLPRSHLLLRWNLAGRPRDQVSMLPPAWAMVKSVTMGSASSGPLLVHWAEGFDDEDPAPLSFLDPQMAKPVSIRWQVSPIPRQNHARVEVRASPNGQVFGLWTTNLAPQGMQTIVLGAQDATASYQNQSGGHVLPGPGGQTIYTGIGLFNNLLQPVLPKHPSGALLLPAVHDDYYLSVEPPIDEPQPGARNRVFVRHRTNPQLRVEVPNLDLTIAEGPEREGLPLDKRLFFIPSAKLIVVIPPAGDRLMLHKFDVNAAPRK